MVSFNVKDEVLPKLEQKVNLSKFQTKNTYRIYGLAPKDKNGNNQPQVLIEYLGGKFPKESFDWLENFLKSKKIDVCVSPLQPPKGDGNHKYDVYIGLGMQIRQKSQRLCNAITQTVVRHLEDKLIKDDKKGAKINKAKK